MDEDDAIIDISSDEESLVDASFDISEEWLNELLASVDVEVLEDLDDIVVVDEISTQSRLKKLRPSQKESDEDCLILDGDPDKAASVVDGNSESFDGRADLLIIGEKGHLACRDYPHPRHLCVSFPFSSTPHEKHCKLCHCYVCDSLAPCIYWGHGLSKTDHCHASEKDQDWKSLRNYFKLAFTEASESLGLPGSRQSNPQPFRSSQEIHHPWPGLSSTLHQSSTTGPATTIPDPSIRREHQQLCPSLTGVRALPVNRRTPHSIGSQSFSRIHATQRVPPVPNYFGSTIDESSSLYSQDRFNSNQLRRTPVQSSLYSEVLQVSQRAPLANGQSIQPAAPNELEIIRGMLASIEADLLGTDYSNGSMEEGYISSATSSYHALNKTSAIGEAQARI